MGGKTFEKAAVDRRNRIASALASPFTIRFVCRWWSATAVVLAALLNAAFLAIGFWRTIILLPVPILQSVSAVILGRCTSARRSREFSSEDYWPGTSTIFDISRSVARLEHTDRKLDRSRLSSRSPVCKRFPNPSMKQCELTA
jgi:hypothetical protein